MPSSYTVTLDSNQIANLTRRGGAVDRNMEKRAQRVLAASVVQAPVGKSRPATKKRAAYVGGRLRASGAIAPDPQIAAAWLVIFNTYYAGYVDQGTERMRARPFLTGNLDLAVQ